MNGLLRRFGRRKGIKLDTERFTQLVLMHLFPQMLSLKAKRITSGTIYRKLLRLLKSHKRSICAGASCAKLFVGQLVELREELLYDAKFIAQNDPAANGPQEIIIAYPGFLAICTYRLAHVLAMQGVPLIPRIMTEWAHSQTGIDIHPGALIGREFFIDHGTGIVIGETAIVGNRVKIYQGVTIGALSVNKESPQKKRHPTIEDDVIIYAGSTILGGSTTIGQNSIIGGNVWLTKSVAPNSLVYHESRVVVRGRGHTVPSRVKP